MIKQFVTLLLCVTLFGCHMSNTSTLFTGHPSDEALTNAVRQAMVSNPIVADAPIQVEAHQGQVSLSGYVRTIRQSDTAYEVATKVAGVHGVQNNLIVKKW